MPEPTSDVRAELAAWLEQDSSKTGQVYRLSQEGLRPDEIAARLNVRTSGFVSNYRSIARAMLEGHVPSGATMAQQVANALQKPLASHNLTDAARTYLREQIRELEQVTQKKWTLHPTPPAGVTSQAPRSPVPSVVSHQEGDRASAPPVSMRVQVEDEVRGRTKGLVDRIYAETDLAAQDYRSIVASDRPLDAVVRVIRWRYDEGTYDELQLLGRRDLTLEHAVVAWADDLPLTYDLVDEAKARIDSFFDRPRSKDN